MDYETARMSKEHKGAEGGSYEVELSKWKHIMRVRLEVEASWREIPNFMFSRSRFAKAEKAIKAYDQERPHFPKKTG